MDEDMGARGLGGAGHDGPEKQDGAGATTSPAELVAQEASSLSPQEMMNAAADPAQVAPCTMKFGSTARALAKRMLKYYRISYPGPASQHSRLVIQHDNLICWDKHHCSSVENTCCETLIGAGCGFCQGSAARPQESLLSSASQILGRAHRQHHS